LKTKNIVIFASGTGSNFKALHQAALKREIPARITALISDNPDAGALEYARDHGIKDVVLPPSSFDDANDYLQRLNKILDEESPSLIVLAGYLKKIPDEIVDRYRRRIINIHPALLPKYGGKGWYGMRVHRAVIDNGDKESGCTVHYVTSVYDEGPIIAQVKVPVRKDDTAETLAQRVLNQEHLLYPKVVRFLLSNS
jgi:phosphoribosylglycinamide formyltransferase 1